MSSGIQAVLSPHFVQCREEPIHLCPSPDRDAQMVRKSVSSHRSHNDPLLEKGLERLPSIETRCSQDEIGARRGELDTSLLQFPFQPGQMALIFLPGEVSVLAVQKIAERLPRGLRSVA